MAKNNASNFDIDQIVKAWANFNTAGTIQDSIGVSGVVKNGTGDFTVTFSPVFTTANYAAMFQPLDTGAGVIVSSVSAQTASTCQIEFFTAA